MTVNQRIKEVKKYSEEKGITFHTFINISSSTVKNVIGERNSAPSHRLLEAILTNFPEINAYWLILGKGEMILPKEALLKSDLEKRVLVLEKYQKEQEDGMIEQGKLIKELTEKIVVLGKEIRKKL